MNVTLLSEDDIKRIIADVFQDTLKAQLPKYAEKIGVDEAARLLGRSKQTIHRWTCYSYKDIPFSKHGTRVVFDLNELKAWARPLGMINN
jgi:excisionase family DNA binding protein